ncbi:MAG: hypothetical protein AAGB97_04145 [Dehalococcoidia bacterium]|nr:hypothetical protein [Chloroflexota bacterium]
MTDVHIPGIASSIDEGRGVPVELILGKLAGGMGVDAASAGELGFKEAK